MKSIKFYKRDTTAYIELDRPYVKNALDFQVYKEMRVALHEISEDIMIRTVILTGSESVFCAGVDLRMLSEINYEEFYQFLRLQHQVWRLIESIPAVVISYINGPAIGVGFELALCCDLRVGTEDCYFHFPEPVIGFPAAMQRLSRYIGVGKTQEILFLARKVYAKEALELGLLHKICSSTDEKLKAAEELAEGFANYSRLAVSMIKRSLNAAIDESKAEQELNAVLACYGSPYFREYLKTLNP